MYLGIVNTGYATSFFTPTILTQLGWKSIHAQVMSIPIFIVATVLALTTAVVTDRLKHRFGAIIIGCCVATAGYAILLNMEHVPVGARYFALYLITGGGYIAQPVVIVWLSNNVSGHYKRGEITLRTLNNSSS
jgi:cyanate permease